MNTPTDPSKGQIFFCGDVHGCFDHIIEAVSEHEPVAIILLGDVQAQRPLQKELAPILDKTEIWFIHGNHDTDSDADYDNLFGSALADRNLDGRVVEIAGVRIAGLGGIFRGQVWWPPAAPSYLSAKDFEKQQAAVNRWRNGMALRHRSTIFPDVFERLAAMRADVLVTHEGPSVHPHGFSALDELARRMEVRQAFHGHHHDRIDYSGHWDRLGYKAFGVGFCGITAMDGTVILAGDYDTVSRS